MLLRNFGRIASLHTRRHVISQQFHVQGRMSLIKYKMSRNFSTSNNEQKNSDNEENQEIPKEQKIYNNNNTSFGSSYGFGIIGLGLLTGMGVYAYQNGVEKLFDAAQMPFITIFESLSSIFGQDDSLLIPPAVPDTYGQIPKTLVLNFEKVLAHVMWSRDGGYLVRKRPFVTQFLLKMHLEGWEIIVWSSGAMPDMEQHIMDLDQYRIIRHKIYREQCNFENGALIKDLTRLGRDMNNVVYVDYNDSNLKAAEDQQDNSVIVKPFTDDVNDHDLVVLTDFLQNLQDYNVSNVRRSIPKYNAFINNAGSAENIFKSEKELVRKGKQLLRDTNAMTGITTNKQGSGNSSAGWLASLFGLGKGGKVNMEKKNKSAY